MNGLLASDGRDGHARLSLSAFRAAMQKLRLIASGGLRMLAVAALAVTALAATAGPPAGGVSAVFAADSLVGGDRPDIRTPRIAPQPRVQRPAIGAGSAAATSNCRSRCGSACETMSCSGLVGSQCSSMRQQCRMNCASRC